MNMEIKINVQEKYFYLKIVGLSSFFRTDAGPAEC
jgi:hypothetical protein